MATPEQKTVSEIKAFARGIHISPRKVRLVANLLKNLPVDQALVNLQFTVKQAALPVKKLVASAIANAKHNFQIEEGRLFIKSLTVDAGQVMKRFKPRAQGRAFPIRKRVSNINIVLGVSDKVRVAKRKIAAPAAVAHTDKTEEKEAQSSAAEESKSRFSFLKRKKTNDPTQVPPKQDVKGKHYTSFDRRAGE